MNDQSKTREFLRSLGEGPHNESGRPVPGTAKGSGAREALSAFQEAYKLAQRTRRNGTWEPPAISGDSATREGVELGLPRVREQLRNNPQLKKARQTLVDLVTGCGLQAFASPFPPVLDFELAAIDPQDLRYAWESDKWFERWANDPKQCDFEGKLTWWEMQRLAFGELPAVGDVLLLRCTRRDRGRLIPLCYQVIERDQLDRTMDRPAMPGQNRIVNGIELDADNREVAFWLYDAHPDDHYYGGVSNTTSRRIPADRILHLFRKDRPSQSVGFTWYHANAQTGRDRNWLVGSNLYKEAIGALLVLIHYTDLGASSRGIDLDGEEFTPDFGDGKPEVKMAEGGVSTMVDREDKVELFRGDSGAGKLAEFLDALDHDGAAGSELSHLRYTGRWAKLSYTAGRGAQLDDEMHVKPIQRLFALQFVLPVRSAVNEQMAVIPYRGRDRYTTVTPAEFLDDPRFQEFFCVGPGREMLDPEMETGAATAKLRSGLSSLIQEAAKAGKHWIQLLAEIRQVNWLLDQWDIVLDFSKGQGGQNSSTSTTRDSAAAAAESVDAAEA